MHISFCRVLFNTGQKCLNTTVFCFKSNICQAYCTSAWCQFSCQKWTIYEQKEFLWWWTPNSYYYYPEDTALHSNDESVDTTRKCKCGKEDNAMQMHANSKRRTAAAKWLQYRRRLSHRPIMLLDAMTIFHSCLLSLKSKPAAKHY